MVKDKFSFGSNPTMKEVPIGQHAGFTFAGDPKIVETEWGEKYSFPIVLSYHPSYESLPPTGNLDADLELQGQTITCDWQSKSLVAKELFTEYGKNNSTFIKAYKSGEWRLTRFDNGSYWLDQL